MLYRAYIVIYSLCDFIHYLFKYWISKFFLKELNILGFYENQMRKCAFWTMSNIY